MKPRIGRIIGNSDAQPRPPARHTDGVHSHVKLGGFNAEGFIR